jgi:vacuolar-type H+-ATPase subunit E/Vma4
MAQNYLIERILKDANDEAKKIVAEAKKTGKLNIEIAQKNAEKKIAEAKKTAKKHHERERDILQSTIDVAQRLETLTQKRKIVDRVFNEAFDEIKYNWRVEKHPKYEERLTKECLMSELREQIESSVVGVLWK